MCGRRAFARTSGDSGKGRRRKRLESEWIEWPSIPLTACGLQATCSISPPHFKTQHDRSCLRWRTLPGRNGPNGIAFACTDPNGSLGKNSDNTFHRPVAAIARSSRMIASRNCFSPHQASIVAVEQSDCAWPRARIHRIGANAARLCTLQFPSSAADPRLPSQSRKSQFISVGLLR